MALKTIQQEWEGFSAMVLAKLDPSPTQVAEMKKAFFAGAWAMLSAFREIGEPHVSEEAGIQFIEDRQTEGKAFYRDLIKRYAESN